MDLTMPVLVASALIDSINPCAIGVMGFLVVFLTYLKASKSKIAKIGMTYIFFVFLTYFLFGLVLREIATFTVISKIVYAVATIFVFIAGLINIKDFFFYGKGVSLAISKKHKHIIKKLIKKATIPASILLGISVSAFELPCTGGVYIAIISLLAKEASRLSGVFYLAIYNIIFVSPLILILLVALASTSHPNFEEWLDKNRRLLRLAMGIGMLCLGAYMAYRLVLAGA